MSAPSARTHKEPGRAPELQRYADDLQWAQALVLVYPTWWSGQPAMLKGWIDRVWVAGVAWELPPGANVSSGPAAQRPPDRRRSPRTGRRSSINALEGESGKRTVTRSMRAMCAQRARTTWCAMYGLDTAGAETPRALLWTRSND